MILGRLYDLALWPHPWPWFWSWNFKVRVWNSFISGMANWHGTKRMWVIYSWPWYWLVWPWWGGRMYRIVTGVTSDVGMPSTYLVSTFLMKTWWDHMMLTTLLVKFYRVIFGFSWLMILLSRMRRFINNFRSVAVINENHWLTMHLLSIECTDWPKLHDKCKACDAKACQREFPVWFPVRVCA